MIIQKKRIRDISPYISSFTLGSRVILGISNIERFTDTLSKIGFSAPFKVGQTLLPAVIGSVSLYNSEGKYLKHKDQPMETVYRQGDWEWKEWDGTWHSKIVDIPYRRYPRTFIEPPAVELSFVESGDKNLLLVSPAYKVNDSDSQQLTHCANLFLELFGEVQIFTEDLESIIKTPLHRLNWVILPQGEIPWEHFKKEIDPIVKSAPEGNQKVLYYRLEVVNSLKPDFRAIGSGGFHGYIVHGFTKDKIYLLESVYYGNATYVFDKNWEILSQLTKAQILSNDFQEARIIHRQGWKKKVSELFS